MFSCRAIYFAAILTVFTLVSAVGEARSQSDGYDPLRVQSGIASAYIDLTVSDPARNRDIPLRIYLPAGKTPAPVVLFSPGLGANREGYAYLGEHWAARGYVVVVMQHPGSDDSVWKGRPLTQVMPAMTAAASLQNFLLRAQDVPAVLNRLQSWDKTHDHPLFGRLDLAHVGMSGHSFGAVTTQAVSGETFGIAGSRFTDPRIKAAIALSPSSPRPGAASKNAFGAVAIPWMLMTGTKDNSPIGQQNVAARLAVFLGLPAGSKYEAVLNNAEHSAFSDRALPGDQEIRNPNHHRVILALSTAFWDAYLRGQTDALAWLKGNGPRTVLEQKDQWQTK